jgi:hypothetical protein
MSGSDRSQIYNLETFDGVGSVLSSKTNISRELVSDVMVRARFLYSRMNFSICF